MKVKVTSYLHSEMFFVHNLSSSSNDTRKCFVKHSTLLLFIIGQVLNGPDIFSKAFNVWEIGVVSHGFTTANLPNTSLQIVLSFWYSIKVYVFLYTAGNNADRTLIVQTYNTNAWHGLNYFGTPSDSLSDRLMVEVRYFGLRGKWLQSCSVFLVA